MGRFRESKEYILGLTFIGRVFLWDVSVAACVKKSRVFFLSKRQTEYRLRDEATVFNISSAKFSGT